MWQEMGNRVLLPKYANFLRSVESIRQRTKENLHRTVIKKRVGKGEGGVNGMCHGFLGRFFIKQTSCGFFDASEKTH